MAAVTKHLLRTAYEERNFYRAQIRQNWLAPLQGAVLLVAAPFLFKQALGYIPDFSGFFSSHKINLPVVIVLTWPAFAAIFLIFQILLSIFPNKKIFPSKKKELSEVAKLKLFIDEEEVRLCDTPIELCPLEVQDIIFEIVRVRMIPVVTKEILHLKRKLVWLSLLQAITTIIIAVPITIYAFLVVSQQPSHIQN
jgi:hypothetical protein